MKMYSKERLSYKNGIIVADDGEVIGVPNKVVDLANKLETMNQKADWLQRQPVACAGPDFDSFVRDSEKKIGGFAVDTPALDKKIDECYALMDELDLVETNDQMNEMMQEFADLMLWCEDDSVLSYEVAPYNRFDLPTLGNPLEWTEATVQSVVAKAHGVNIDSKLYDFCSDEECIDVLDGVPAIDPEDYGDRADDGESE